MAVTLTVGGVSKSWLSESLHVSKTANGRSTLNLDLKSTDGSYRAAIDDEVVLSVGGVPEFGGLVERPSEQGLNGHGNTDAIRISITATDYNVYPERRYVNETLAGGSLESMLTTLVANYLTGYGVTLHGSQVTGPTLPTLDYEYVRLDDVLNQLATLTADFGEPFVWNIDASKVLRMFQPSTQAAPFNITSNATQDVAFDIRVEEDGAEKYNEIILKALPKSEIEREETFVFGTDAYPYVPQYTPSKHYGYITHETIFETLRTPDDPDTASWTYDPTTRELERDAGTPGTGDVTIFKFDGTFSGTWTATAPGTTDANRKQRVITVESIPEDQTGQSLVDSYLAKSLTPAETLHYSSFTPGIQPGQSQTVTLSRRGLSGTAVITDVVIRDIGTNDADHQLIREITAVIDDAQTNLERGWRNFYDNLDRTGGAAPPPIVSGVSQAGPGGEDEDVQSNADGKFYGKNTFKHKRATNSLVCGGGGSSITAADHESCFVFGYNCHITD